VIKRTSKKIGPVTAKLEGDSWGPSSLGIVDGYRKSASIFVKCQTSSESSSEDRSMLIGISVAVFLDIVKKSRRLQRT